MSEVWSAGLGAVSVRRYTSRLVRQAHHRLSCKALTWSRAWLDGDDRVGLDISAPKVPAHRDYSAGRLTCAHTAGRTKRHIASSTGAKITEVNLSRGKSWGRVFDLREFDSTADFTKLPVLHAGDTLYVPTQDGGLFTIVCQVVTDLVKVFCVAARLGIL